MDVSNLQALISDYEGLVIELTHELKNVKSEHEDLKTKIPTVVNENQKLLDELKYYVNAKRTRESKTECELIQNLRAQINLVLNEKEQITQLWQKATKSVDILENELTIYKSDTPNNFFPKQEYVKAKQAYEEKIATLETRLKIIQNQLDAKTLEVKNLLENTVTSTAATKHSESKIGILNKKISDLEDLCENLKKKYRDKEKIVQKVMDQNNEFREKVVEALEVVHAALNEKDASLLREAKIRSEMKKMHEELDNIIKCVEEKCNKDIVIVREEAGKRYAELLDSHRKLQEELQCKLIVGERQQAKNIILQNEIDKISAGGMDTDESKISKLLILEKNLESTFQKLLVSEKQNIQLKSDLDAIKNDMEQMAAYYERVLKAKEVEKVSLQNIINQLQSFVNEKDLTIRSIENELERQKSKTDILDKDCKNHIDKQEKLINEIKTEKNQMAALFAEQIKEFQSEIESKDKVNRKVLEETKEILYKLENLTKHLKTDNHKLRKENKKVKDELDVYRRKLFHYKETLSMLALDVNKINTAYTSSQQQQQPNILS